MKIDGGCHCGFIKFEAEIDPDAVAICHCADCQTLSGAPFRTGVVARDGTFTLISGEPKTYEKTAESGTKRAQGFCPECGSSIYSTSAGEGPKSYRLRVSAIRQRDQIVPKAQIWTRSAQSWVNDLASLRAKETQ